MRVAVAIELADEERATLDGYARGRSTPARLVLRAKIVLKAASGRQTRRSPKTWAHSRRPWASGAIGSPSCASRASRRTRPAEVGRSPSAPRRSPTSCASRRRKRRPTRAVEHARHGQGVGGQRLDRRPHLACAWAQAASRADLQAEQRPRVRLKLENIVGLYLNPPANAIVLSCDENSQIQALDRTQPSLPFRRGERRPSRTTTSATARRRCSPR